MRATLDLRALLPCIPFAVAACGGATDTIDTGDGGGQSDAGDGGQRSDGGGGGVDAADCNALAADVDALQAKAQTCCATCNIVQCTQVVDGLCCPVTVNSATSQATLAFVAAVQQYHQQCPNMCPAISCPKAPSGICGGTGATGECE